MVLTELRMEGLDAPWVVNDIPVFARTGFITARRQGKGREREGKQEGDHCEWRFRG